VLCIRAVLQGLESRFCAFAVSRRGFALSAALFLAALALALFLGLGTETLARISEVRCVQVVKRMVESGDWLVPRLGEIARLQKPPLFYWAGAAVATVTSDSSAWSVRFVSACAAFGLAGVMLAWGRALGGGGLALAAAACLAAMQQFGSSGRRGDAEMLLAFLSTAALLCFDRMHAERRAKLLPVFALLLGLAILTKATAVLITVAAPIAVFLALRRELAVLRDRRVLAAGGAALALGLSWYLAILVFVPGAFETLRDALFLPLGADESQAGSTHFKWPWWYFSILPVRAAPASLLLPLVIWRLWVTRVYRDDPRMRFASLAFLVPLAVFSVLPQKQKHYTLSMMPGLALCSAEALLAAARELGPRFTLAIRALGTPLALAGVAATVVLALFFLWVERWSPGAVTAGAAVPFALFVLAAAAALAGARAAFGASWILGFLLALAVGRGVVEPRVESLARSYIAMSLDERENLILLARDRPWFARLMLRLGSSGEDGD